MQYTIQEWCHMAFNLACVKGFHTQPGGEPYDHKDPIRIGSRIALIHSELSEALECITRGKEALYFGEKEKPEGLGVELADVMIRTFDLAKSLGFADLLQEPDPTRTPIGDYVKNGKPDSKAYVVYTLHMIASMMGVAGTEGFQALIDATFSFAQSQGIDLWKMIALKHEYNTSRPLRHGGKLL